MTESTGFQIKRLGEMMIPMNDGVHLAADAFVPAAEGKFPAIVAYGVWSKEMSADLQFIYPPQPPPSFLWNGVIEGGDSEFLVSRGYAHIMVQIRGIGHSEGTFDLQHGLVGPPTDLYETIEWVAQQPWCDGNVGMIGISAFAMTQMFASILKPPSLKAVFPYDTPSDLYRDGFYDGGVLSLFLANLQGKWAVNSFNPEELSALKGLAREVREKFLSDEPDFLKDYTLNDYMMYTSLYDLMMHPQKSPATFGFMMNPFDGEMYRKGSFCSHYEEIELPVYCGSGWYSGTYVHLPGAFRTYNGLNKVKAKRMIIGPDLHGPGDRWMHLERPWHQYHDEIVRWYDYWLKGIDTGIMDEPPIKLFVMGANRWRYEYEWPLERTQWKKYYLRSFQRLMTEPSRSSEFMPDSFVQQPLNTSNEIGSLVYQTQPLSDDIEVTGPMALYLYASINAENKRWVDTNWSVAIKDVLPGGEERELTRGYLKASHRACDESKSKPWQPYHPHTEEALEKIEADKIYEFAIEIRPMAYVFKSGHRIRLEIRSAELPYLIFDISNHVARNDVVWHKIYRSKEYQSHLLLPVIPFTDTKQWLDEERAQYLPGLFDGTATKRTTPNIL